MAFAACLTDRFLLDMANGVHQPGDTYKIALYLKADATTLNKSLTAYTSTGELPTANGYTRDDKVLADRVAALSGHNLYIDFSDPVWLVASFSADAALIYNASRSNAAMAVLDIGPTTSTNAPFTVEFPAPGAGAAIVIQNPS